MEDSALQSSTQSKVPNTISAEEPRASLPFPSYDVTSSHPKQDLLSLKEWGPQEYLLLFTRAQFFSEICQARTSCDILNGKQMITAFYERSSRTRLSFESAMLRLGGSVLGHASPELTHAGDNYQESLADLLQMFQSYADIIVIRHPKTGVLEDVAPSAAIPVINCGDGMGEHPTQLLIDAYTLLCRFGTLSNLHIACVGDMRMRVFHSLFCLARTFDWTLELCPPPHSEVPQEWMDFLDKNQLRYSLHNNLCPAIKTADVIYVDSVLPHEHSLGQYASNDYIEEVVSRYQITPELLQNHARNDIVVLHPLPRGPELPQSLDATKFNLYWNQASNAVPIRMAVLEKLLCQNLSYDSDTRIGPLA